MAKSKEMVVEAEFEETGETPEIPPPPVVLSLPGGGTGSAPVVAVSKPQVALGGSIHVPAHRNLYDHNH